MGGEEAIEGEGEERGENRGGKVEKERGKDRG